MTTEDDFQNELDRRPTNYTLRTIFADWLDDHGDPRGPGYRALGVLKLRPSFRPALPYDAAYDDMPSLWTPDKHGSFEWWIGRIASETTNRRFYPILPWFGLLSGVSGGYVYANEGEVRSRDYWTRREAEDAAATAFTLLAPDTQVTFLTPKGAKARRTNEQKGGHPWLIPKII